MDSIRIADGLVRQFPRYKDKDRVRADLIAVTRRYPSLVPQRGKLTLNGGEECDLIMLHGTVPTFYKGRRYNTPVELYIREDYPAYPPTCYIRPSQGMSLKTGHEHVDQSGLVFLPYLHEWAAMTHNLEQLCDFMSRVFGEDPPLYVSSRATSSSTSQPQYMGHGNQPPRPVSYGTLHLGPPRTTPDLPPRPRPEDVRRDKERELTVKLQSELQGIYTKLRTEMDTAFENQTKLERNRQELDTYVEDLSRRKASLTRLVEESQERCVELDVYLEEQKKQGEPDVNELIEPGDALSEQMLGLVAENASLEDCLYYLDKAVTDGVITVDVFLREVRRLARKQFIARATAKRVEDAQRTKIAAKANFTAKQPGNQTHAYPRLPQQQGARGQLYHEDTPPPYTPSPGAGAYPSAAPPAYHQTFGPGQGTAGPAGQWGRNVGAGSGAARSPYAGYRGGNPYGAVYGNQTPHTQRR